MKKILLLLISFFLVSCNSVTTQYKTFDKLNRDVDTHWAKVRISVHDVKDVLIEASTWGLAAPKNFTFMEYASSKELAYKEAKKSCEDFVKEKNYKKVRCIKISSGGVAKTKEQIKKEKIAAEKKKEEEEFLAMVNKAKNQCKLFGFEEKSTEMRDCVLKLYTQEMNNKIALETARMQKEVAERNARANERSANIAANERSRKMMQRGVRSLHDNCILKGTC